MAGLILRAGWKVPLLANALGFLGGFSKCLDAFLIC